MSAQVLSRKVDVTGFSMVVSQAGIAIMRKPTYTKIFHQIQKLYAIIRMLWYLKCKKYISKGSLKIRFYGQESEVMNNIPHSYRTKVL